MGESPPFTYVKESGAAVSMCFQANPSPERKKSPTFLVLVSSLNQWEGRERGKGGSDADNDRRRRRRSSGVTREKKKGPGGQWTWIPRERSIDDRKVEDRRFTHGSKMRSEKLFCSYYKTREPDIYQYLKIGNW